MGIVIGSLLPQRVAQRLGLGHAILLGIVLAIPSELLTALASGPPLQATVMAVAGFFLAGVTIPIYDVNQFSLRQAVIPLHMQGRGNATLRTIIRGAIATWRGSWRSAGGAHRAAWSDGLRGARWDCRLPGDLVLAGAHDAGPALAGAGHLSPDLFPAGIAALLLGVSSLLRDTRN